MVYIVPYDNEELIHVINIRLIPHEKASIINYNGINILANSESGVMTYKLRIGYKFVAFNDLDSAKKFIENNVKGE